MENVLSEVPCLGDSSMAREQVNNISKLIEENIKINAELAKKLESMICEDISKIIHDEFEKLKKKG
nr:MAG TPA: hypothetical protein [Bacteriophage sp.]